MDWTKIILSILSIFATGLIIKVSFFSSKNNIVQNQKNGSNSTNYQTGGDLNINDK